MKIYIWRQLKQLETYPDHFGDTREQKIASAARELLNFLAEVFSEESIGGRKVAQLRQALDLPPQANGTEG